MRQGFGEVESSHQFETAATAVAARQQALVQARFIMAVQRPRDVDEFRVRLLKECKRPGFAEMAEYSRPVGKEYNQETEQWEDKIAHGPSVHLIRTALALYKNIDADSVVVFENSESRVTHTYVLDLETNVGWGRTLTIPKIVEKRGYKARHGKESEPPRGRDIIGQRVNTSGETVYICIATDDEIRVKEASLVAKAQRENGRSLLPRDILDEAIMVANQTMKAEDARDPDAAKKKFVDQFEQLNVTPEDLAAYLGHPVAKCTPNEVAELRKVLVSLREGELSWTQIMADKDPTGSVEAAEKVASEKLAKMRAAEKQPAEEKKQPADAQLTEEEMRASDPVYQEQLQQEKVAKSEAPKQQGKITFGGKR